MASSAVLPTPTSTPFAVWWQRLVAYDRARPYVTDAAAALALGIAASVWLVVKTDHGLTLWLCQVGLVVPLAWRRRFPLAVFSVIAAVALVQWLVAEPLLADAALLVALFTIALERPLRAAVAAAAILEVGVVMASVRWALADSWARSLVGLSGLAAAALFAGVILQVRRAHLVALTDRAARLEEERDRQAEVAAAAERTRIAREMHDVIAHSLAVIVTMADGAVAKLPRDPDRAASAVRSIADVSRQALGDTRRLLGVLRDAPDGAGLAPQPGLGQLGDLMGQLRATGLDADLAFEGQPFALTPAVELTVYRLLQEAGTNTLKHASGATRFAARLRYDYPRLSIEATDDGAPTAAPVVAGGHGTAGMRERVALYGGTVHSGPAPEGGWRVAATLTAATAGNGRRG